MSTSAREDIFNKCLRSLAWLASNEGKISAWNFLSLMVDRLDLSDDEFDLCKDVIKSAGITLQ